MAEHRETQMDTAEVHAAAAAGCLGCSLGCLLPRHCSCGWLHAHTHTWHI